MQSWEAKKAGVTRQRSYVLPKTLRDQGVTINASPTAAAAVYAQSAVIDPSPANIIAGQPARNSTDTTIDYQAVSANQALILSLQAGIAGCTYVVTLSMTLSDGEPFSEDILQYVSTYEPVP